MQLETINIIEDVSWQMIHQKIEFEGGKMFTLENSRIIIVSKLLHYTD